MTATSRRDAHRVRSGPVRQWDHVAYQRWLSGIDHARQRPRQSRVAAVASVGCVVGALVAAWLTGVLSMYLGWLVELMP